MAKTQAEAVLADARKATRRRKLADHLPAILRLRKKGWTYRAIQTFLNERGVKADHSTVYLLVKQHEQKNG